MYKDMYMVVCICTHVYVCVYIDVHIYMLFTDLLSKTVL